MKRTFVILFLTLFSSGLVLGQEVLKEKKRERNFNIGIFTGLYLSQFTSGSENDWGSLGNPKGYNVTYETNLGQGFTLVVFLK